VHAALEEDVFARSKGESQMIRVDVARILIVDDKSGAVLMVKSVGREGWELPGGQVEPGERLPQAVTREAWEEAGVAVEVGDLVEVLEQEFPRSQHHMVRFTFLGRIIGGVPHVERPDEIEEVAWMERPAASLALTGDPDGIDRLLRYPCRYVNVRR
jgi:8-oxo-dGTP diphosphatase